MKSTKTTKATFARFYFKKRFPSSLDKLANYLRHMSVKKLIKNVMPLN